MKISRFLKTIFLLEFVSGLLIATREIFRSKKLLTILMRKVL